MLGQQEWFCFSVALEILLCSQGLWNKLSGIMSFVEKLHFKNSDIQEERDVSRFLSECVPPNLVVKLPVFEPFIF